MSVDQGELQRLYVLVDDIKKNLEENINVELGKIREAIVVITTTCPLQRKITQDSFDSVAKDFVIVHKRVDDVVKWGMRLGLALIIFTVLLSAVYALIGGSTINLLTKIMPLVHT
jgi:uncharacterized membrane protein (DUF485 family)